jgi:hypothetical protein
MGSTQSMAAVLGGFISGGRLSNGSNAGSHPGSPAARPGAKKTETFANGELTIRDFQ